MRYLLSSYHYSYLLFVPFIINTWIYFRASFHLYLFIDSPPLYPHYTSISRWLVAGFLGAAMVGITFPLWGLLLADVQSIFYLHDTQRLRNESATNAEYFIELGVCSLLGFIIQNYCVAQVGERVTSVLRSQLFESILRREIAYFDDEKNSVGALTVRLSDDPRYIHEATGESFANQLQALCTLIVGLSIGFSATWKVSLVVLACFPISVAAGALRSARNRQGGSDSAGDEDKKKGRKGKKSTKQTLPGKDGISGPQGIIAAAFTHMRTVSAFSMQHEVSEQYCEIMLVASQNRRQGSLLSGLLLGNTIQYFLLTSAQHTLAISPIRTPYPHTLYTHPIHTSFS